MTIEHQELLLVVQAAEQGSLAAAARSLDLEPPAVTKRLAALERRLGVRLFHRTTRRLSLTDEGELFCGRAREVLARLSSLESELQDSVGEARGAIRLASSFGFGRRWVAPALARFQQAHPRVELKLELMEHLPDLASAGLDAAVWLWSPTRASSVARKLASNRRVLVAAPAYAERHGVPASPQELPQHACLIVREHEARYATWRLSPVNRPRATPVTVQVHGALSSNSGEVVRDWALAGHGIMLRSLWDVHPLLADGTLLQVLPGYAMLDADVHWIAPPRTPGGAVPLRLRLLQDHLASSLADPPWLKPLPSARPRR
ncbi:LysR family transcriptional regulator [Schlegelella sp. S2-27]|uniref:LysR family transcriptional regulator n=1 Tax=Caldimonas mangrovi TaxID=2944811 RepID=A0ABT0YP30_9BURK|nr:LysR family transcriptional regulator [Caldimonas mangrovi]MCM5680413.1 LysR family transcriptional regulator [Caldimonas mangrovi]